MKVVVVDDEAPARRRLTRLLESVDDVEVVGQASDGVEALAVIAEKQPDVVFLDIEMPELGGLDVARHVAAGDNGPAIIFATAYDEHALAAFDAAAVDYLVKPIARDRLADAVERARLRHGRPDSVHSVVVPHAPDRPRRFAVKSGAKFVVIDPNQISAVVSQDHYATIICGERELLSDDPLDTVLARLDPERFLRVHRSGIINLDFLSELTRLGDRKYVAKLSDQRKTEVPISRDKLQLLKQRLGIS